MPSSRPGQDPVLPNLTPEQVAYWYLRLNGFLLLENFILHDVRNGGQRTDADLLGARFRHRREFSFDRAEPMEDDTERLRLSERFDDVVMVEVKTNQPCTLNGPWTDPDRQNLHRVLAAIGCISQDQVSNVAGRLYAEGVVVHGDRRIRLIAVGRDHNAELQAKYSDVVQLTWDDVLTFIWRRLTTFRRQKRDVSQWDRSGKVLHRLANRHYGEPVQFIGMVKRAIGVRQAGNT